MAEAEDLRRERDNLERLNAAYRVERDMLLTALTNIAVWILPGEMDLSDPQTEAEQMIAHARTTIARLPRRKEFR